MTPVYVHGHSLERRRHGARSALYCRLCGQKRPTHGEFTAFPCEPLRTYACVGFRNPAALRKVVEAARKTLPFLDGTPPGDLTYGEQEAVENALRAALDELDQEPNDEM